jgi:hypothetical protein
VLLAVAVCGVYRAGCIYKSYRTQLKKVIFIIYIYIYILYYIDVFCAVSVLPTLGKKGFQISGFG